MALSREAIVYAWADFDQRNIGGRALPSSMDNYDVEYGWSANDFARAAGGTIVNFYTIGINALFLDSGRDVLIATRIKRMPDNPIGGSPIVTGFPADAVILHRSGNKLIDVGLYGIYDTLTGECLFKFSASDYELLGYEAPHLFFIKQGHKNGVSRIDLEAGIGRGKFVVEKVVGERSASAFFLPSSGFGNRISDQIMGPRSFCVNGESFVVANTKKENWYHVDKSAIVDGSGKVIVQGDSFKKYIVAAVAFPEAVLSGIV